MSALEMQVEQLRKDVKQLADEENETEKLIMESVERNRKLEDDLKLRDMLSVLEAEKRKRTASLAGKKRRMSALDQDFVTLNARKNKTCRV